MRLQGIRTASQPGHVKIAFVQPAEGVEAGPALGEELRLFTRAALGGVKCPKQFYFRETLPREPTGKLIKRLLRDELRSG